MYRVGIWVPILVGLVVLHLQLGVGTPSVVAKFGNKCQVHKWFLRVIHDSRNWKADIHMIRVCAW
jgi:hypothetical protein